MPILKNDLLLRAARRQPTERVPVWMMRQAGRTDPKYVLLRERIALPLEELFCDADLSAEISLLPQRIGVDAIILFQDILTPLAPMGSPFIFRPGPLLDKPIRSQADVNALQSYDPTDHLDFVARTIQSVKRSLDGELPVIGFASAPLTLAAFLIEGGSPGHQPPHLLSFMRQEPNRFHALLDKLTDMTVNYLRFQIQAGADAVQLFESCADILTPTEYEVFAQPYHARIFSELGGHVPTILFAKDQVRVDLLARSGADVISVAAQVDLAEAVRTHGPKVAFQGNVDNRVVAQGSFDDIDQAVATCLSAGGGCGHILNLSHGLLRQTPFANVCRFVETAKRIGMEAPTPTPCSETNGVCDSLGG